MTIQEAKQVFALMHKHWPAGSIFRFFAKKGDKSYGMAIGNPAQLQNSVNWAESEGWNSYVQMNPSSRVEGTRMCTEDITHWCWFLIDIDPIAPDADPRLALDRVEDILKGYIGVKELHRYIIDSGRGIQAWYPFPPIPTSGYRRFHTRALQDIWKEQDPTELAGIVEYRMGQAAPRAMSYWLGLLRERLDILGNVGCTVDLCARDLPRVMRMPYTINAKTGRRGNLMTVAAATNTTLASKLLDYAPYSIWKPAEIVELPGVTESTPWQVFIPHMTRAGRLFITEGAEEGGRHHSAVAAVRSLRDLGCSAVQATLALIEGGKMCSPKFEADEVAIIIRRNF